LSFLNFLKRSSKSYDFLKEGTLNVEPILLIVKIAAWQRQIFVCVEVLILCLFTTVKDFADFSFPYRSAMHELLPVYFVVAKNPRDYSFCAAHQLLYA
jgi:hypothetical protein